MNKIRTDKFDVTIDYSEYYDIVLDNTEFYDIVLDNTEYYDFELTDDYINENELTYLEPVCIGCDDAVLSLLGEYAFLLTDSYKFIEIKNGGYILFH